MTEISEVLPLWQGSCSSEVFIESGYARGHVIVCNKEKGVIKYNVDERKLIHGWPLPLNLSVTCPVTEQNNTYTLIGGKKTICTWTDDNLNLLDGLVDDLQEVSIFRHHPVALGEKFSLVLITDGGDAFTYQVQNSSKFSSSEMYLNERCIYSKLLDFHNTKTLITIVKEDGKQLVAKIFLVENVIGPLPLKKKVLISLKSKSENVISCCIQDTTFDITILSDSGVLYHGNLEDSLKRPRDSSLLLTRHTQVYESTAKVDVSQCKLVGIEQSHIALVHLSDTKGSHGTVSLYSSKFLSKVQEREFEICLDNNNEESEVKILGAEYCHGHVVIGTSHAVLACSLSLKHASLASVLGTAATSTAVTQVPDHVVADQPILLPKLKSMAKSIDVVQSAESKQELQLLQKLASFDECSEKKTFQKTLNAYFMVSERKRKRDLAKGVSAQEGVLPHKKRRYEPKLPGIITPQSMMDKVIDKIVRVEELWSKEIIESLIENKMISSRRQSAVIEKLIEKNSVHLLRQLLTFSRGLQEESTASCLRFALQYEIKKRESEASKSCANADAVLCPPLEFDSPAVDKEEDPEVLRKPFGIQYQIFWAKHIDTMDERSKDATCPVASDVAKLLEAVLATSGNEFALEEHLRSLALEETEVLLEFLGYLIVKTYGPYNINKDAKESEEIDIKHNKVVNWIACVVNAQFTSLILSPKLKKLLSRLQFFIRQELRIEYCLDNLQPYLMQLEKKRKLPKCKDRRRYLLKKIVL